MEPHLLIEKLSEKPHERLNLLAIRLLIATWINTSLLSGTRSQSLPILLFCSIHENVRSTTQRLGSTLKPSSGKSLLILSQSTLLPS